MCVTKKFCFYNGNAISGERVNNPSEFIKYLCKECRLCDDIAPTKLKAIKENNNIWTIKIKANKTTFNAIVEGFLIKYGQYISGINIRF